MRIDEPDTVEAYLKASNTGVDNEFGTSVGIWNDTVIVGAPREDNSGLGVKGLDEN